MPPTVPRRHIARDSNESHGWDRRRGARVLPALLVAVLVLMLAIPATAGAHRIPCGTEITASTTLDRNISGCAGNGLVISGNRITLDLAGHRISGADAGSGYGIWLKGSDITIRNGTITGFVDGVHVDPVTEGTPPSGRLEAMRLVRNGAGLAIAPGGGAVGAFSVACSQLVDNDEGLYLTKGSMSITGSTISRNTGDGLHAVNAAGLTVSDSAASGNGENGLDTSNTTSRFLRNVASRNGLTGIRVVDAYATPAPYWFADNTANGNGALGIEFSLDLPDLGFADGGGNVARNNGDGQECVGVTCTRRRAT